MPPGSDLIGDDFADPANLLPFAVVVALAASSGFATPLGYQTDLMVLRGRRLPVFSDDVRIGAPLDIIVMIRIIALAPMAFPLV